MYVNLFIWQCPDIQVIAIHVFPKIYLNVKMSKCRFKRELNFSSWCLVMVEGLFLAVPRGCLQFVIVVFPDHTHLLFLNKKTKIFWRYFLSIHDTIYTGLLIQHQI